AGFARGLIHRVGFFAGLPAPTGGAGTRGSALDLWERASPRRSQHQNKSQPQRPATALRDAP
ncbi:hypothetical protein CVV67_30095, partial [Arthrobacter stackebrandtii]